MNIKKIRSAVIGAGYLGRFHAEKYATLPAAELLAVVDVNEARAAELASKYGVEPLTDHTRLFDRVDAVSVVTPTETHHRIGLDFLSRGVDVLIEKPIAVTLEEADELISASEKSGAILQVGHLERFNPAVVALEGKVKNPMFIESHRLAPFSYRSLDVSVVLDLMIHDIDIILNLVDSEVDRIDAVGIPVISDKVDIANARIRFKNGCVANVTASRVSKEGVRRIRLFQSDAYISIDFAAQHISIYGRTSGEAGQLPKIVSEELDIVKADSLLEEIKSFLECSAGGGGTRPLVTGLDGRRALEVAHRVQEATGESFEALAPHMNA